MVQTNNSFSVLKQGEIYFIQPDIWRKTRLFVSARLVQPDEKISFPVENADLDIENKILIPGENIVHCLYVKCGFRGESFWVIPENLTHIKYLEFIHLSSPLGALGISKYLFLSIEPSSPEIIISWKRTGRLYGKPSKGIVIIRGKNVDVVDEVTPELYQKLRGK